MARVRAAKGEGSVFRLASGKYRASLPMPPQEGIKRPRKEAIFDTEKSANDALRKMRKMRDGGGLDVPAAALTVGEWLTFWLDHIASERVRGATLDGYRSKVALYVTPVLGRTRIRTLTPEHLERVYAGMRDRGLSEATIHQTHAIVRRALTIAARRGRIDKNPAAEIELRELRPRPHPIHDQDEVLRMLGAARTNREAARLHAALSVGLRQSEALGLDWSCIHEAERVPYLVVEQAVSRVRGRGLVMEETKNHTSRRAVPLTPAAAASFALWRGESTGAGLVFPSTTGGMLDPRRDARDWAAAEKRAGLDHRPLHGARGAMVTTLSSRGVPLEVAAQLMGHSTTETTRRHYLRISDGRAADAVLELGAAQMRESSSGE